MRQFGHGPEPGLALHCTLANAGAWRPMAAALSERMTMLAPNLPGHGSLPRWQEGGDYLAAALEQLAPALDRPRHLIGHSFGGVAALAHAMAAPEMVLSLVLIEPVLFAAARKPEIREIVEFNRVELGRRFFEQSPEAAAEFFTHTWGTGIPWSAQSEATRRRIAGQIHIVGDQSPVLHFDRAGLLAPGRLESLRIPVLIVEGTRSPPVVTDIADALAERIPHLRRARIDGAGHMCPLSHPLEVAAAIGAFLPETQVA